VLLANEAKAAREAGALAREEERRRLRRDLHDDLGPSLAALALQADTARDLAGRDPAASLAVLERLVPRLNGTVDSVRALVHELRPPMLDELGLGAAVRELAARMSTPTTPVRAHVGDLPPVPAAVEVAVYRIAGEALANALRHARASEVRLTLTASDGVLALTVADDGAAGTAHRPGGGPGLGLSSMRERAEEIGGTLNVVWAAQGTTVAATLPVRPADGLAQEPADGVVA
jgi:signal transduction histidine kinase